MQDYFIAGTTSTWKRSKAKNYIAPFAIIDSFLNICLKSLK